MIEYLDLEIRTEDRLVAEAVALVSGGLTRPIVEAQIRERQELLTLIDAGLDAPICPELTNANPSSPHTVLLEAQGWLLAQMAYRFNQVPQQNLIAFANLFGIDQRIATAAVTTLTFLVDPPVDTDVTIPLGTQVATADGLYVFETTVALVIAYGDDVGDVAAVRTVNGHTLLQPNVLVNLIDSVAFVDTVTNANAVDSGTELESLAATLSRVAQYQRRGERIVTTKDLEDAILNDALEGNGIVRAFPFVRNGEFVNQIDPLVGYTSVIVMAKTGDNIDSIAMQKIAVVIDEAVGNQFIYVLNPFYVEFDIEAVITINTGAPQGAVLAAVETSLRNFYAASREQFGRPILRSEIIAVIEGTGGVDRIVAGVDAIIASPLTDTTLAEYELPKLGDVTLTVV